MTKRLRFTGTEAFSASNGANRIFEEGNIVEYNEEKLYFIDDKGLSYKINSFAEIATIVEDVDEDGEKLLPQGPTEEDKQMALNTMFDLHLRAFLDKNYPVGKDSKRNLASMFINHFWAGSQFSNELIRLLDETEGQS